MGFISLIKHLNKHIMKILNKLFIIVIYFIAIIISNFVISSCSQSKEEFRASRKTKVSCHSHIGQLKKSYYNNIQYK